MKVVKEGRAKDGTTIRIEDWSENFDFVKRADRVSAYPLNKHGEMVRIERRTRGEAESVEIYEKAISGFPLSGLGFTFKKNGKDIVFEKEVF